LTALQTIHAFIRWLNRPFGGTLLCVVLLALFYQLFGIFGILHEPPLGIHFSRQTDSLSFVSNYFQYGYSTFQPHVYNLSGQNGKAACELPLLYKFMALAYRLVGEYNVTFRGTVLLLTSLGFLSLFRLSLRITRSTLSGILVVFFCLTSTIVLYYSSTFLVDSAALGLTLIGMNVYHREATQPSHKSLLILAAFCFAFAVGLKITFAIFPISIYATHILVIAWPLRKQHYLAIKRTLAPLLGITAITAFILAWYIYAIWYNERHSYDYFLMKPLPYWSLSKEDHIAVFEALSKRWLSAFFPQPVRIVIAASLITVLAFGKRIPAWARLHMIIALVGLMSYFALFFAQFRDHDYYLLQLIPLVALVFIWTLYLLNSMRLKWLQRALYVALTAVCISGLTYSIAKWNQRYDKPEEHFAKIKHGIEHHEAEWNEILTTNATVVVLGDLTQNGSLYFLKRKGYTYKNVEAWNHPKNHNNQSFDAVLLPDSMEYQSAQFEFDLSLTNRLGEWLIYTPTAQ